MEKALTIVNTPLGLTFSMKQKVQALIDFNTLAFNHAVHAVLKTTDYPAGKLDNFPLLDNEDILVIDDIYNILETSGVGIPATTYRWNMKWRSMANWKREPTPEAARAAFLLLPTEN